MIYGLAESAQILEARDTTVAGIGRAPTKAEVNHPKQWDIAHAESGLIAVILARRWGKTVAARLITKLGVCRPNSRTIYATLIRRNCEKFFWRPLLGEMKKLGWDVHARDDDGRKVSNSTNFTLYAPNGAFVQALSCNTLADIESIRGDECDDFLIDECQEPNDDVLQALIFQVAVPMIMQRRGRIFLFGTVPDVEPTTFTDCADNPDWQTFGHSEKKRSAACSVWENPHVDKKAIEETLTKAGLVPGNPIYEREIMGRRVKDPNKIAYEYMEGRNDYDPREIDWRLVEKTGWGIDLGFQDRDALVVQQRLRDGRILVRYAWQHNHLDVLILADLLLVVRDVLEPNVCAGDHGGHGATKVMETLSRILGKRIKSKPGDVMVSVGLVNDDYRTARLLIPTVDIVTPMLVVAARRIFGQEPERLKAVLELLEGEAADLGRESGQVAKTVNPRTRKWEINKKGFHSDLTEANRYCHWGLTRPNEDPLPPPRETDEAKLNALQIQQHLQSLHERERRGRYGRR